MRPLVAVLSLFSLFTLSGCFGTGVKPDQKAPVKDPTPKIPVSIPARADTGAEQKRATILARIDQITKIAEESGCSTYRWKDRGRAPIAYIRGIALVYARSACNMNRPDVFIAASAHNGNDLKDGLSWYHSSLMAAGLDTRQQGIEALRSTYTLLIGLGMRESSGRHCCGRDMSADFSTSTSAEAGLFQTSWGAHRSSPAVLKELFSTYKNGKQECLKPVFSENVRCPSSDGISWGDGDGKDWQELTKQCPAFAAEYAAVVIRRNGGSKGEFGPMREKNVEVRLECIDMLVKIEDLLVRNPDLCRKL